MVPSKNCHKWVIYRVNTPKGQKCEIYIVPESKGPKYAIFPKETQYAIFAFQERAQICHSKWKNEQINLNSFNLLWDIHLMHLLLLKYFPQKWSDEVSMPWRFLMWFMSSTVSTNVYWKTSHWHRTFQQWLYIWICENCDSGPFHCVLLEYPKASIPHHIHHTSSLDVYVPYFGGPQSCYT